MEACFASVSHCIDSTVNGTTIASRHTRRKRAEQRGVAPAAKLASAPPARLGCSVTHLCVARRISVRSKRLPKASIFSESDIGSNAFPFAFIRMAQ
jgi:hypothetical protein